MPLQRMRDDMRLRNYSSRTEETYLARVDALGRHYGIPPDRLGLDQVRSFLLHAINQRGCSWSWWRQTVAALRFFYGRTLGRSGVVPCLPYPRKEFHLPEVLSTTEVEQLFNAVHHLKHRLVLMTIYSGGLRTSEAVGLASENIDTSRMVIQVRQGKGKKDRIVPLSRVLLEALRQYWRLEGMNRWLFPGTKPDSPITAGWVQHATQAAVARAGFSKRVTPRTLRHSFATHLLEAGTDLRIIQALLGHATINATLIYTHLSQRHLASIRSPLDGLDLPVAPRQLVFQGL